MAVFQESQQHFIRDTRMKSKNKGDYNKLDMNFFSVPVINQKKKTTPLHILEFDCV